MVFKLYIICALFLALGITVFEFTTDSQGKAIKYVDKLILEGFKQNKLQTGKIVSDEVFLRRPI